MIGSLALHIDNREPLDLKTWLKENINVACVFENLPAGDFEFRSTDESGTTNSIVLIERKEIEDLCSSLKDGRFDEQKQKLSATVTTNPRPVAFLIEGDYNNHPKCATIDSVILTTQFRDGFFVLRSTNSLNKSDINDTTTTGALLLRISDLIQRGKFEPVSEEELHKRFIASRSIHRAGQSLSRSNDWWQLALSQIDGVGPKAGKAIVARYPTVKTLLDAFAESGPNAPMLLKDVTNASGRRLGQKISAKVFETICGSHSEIGDKNEEPIEKTPLKRKKGTKTQPKKSDACLFDEDD